MKAEIRRLHSPDVDLKTFEPTSLYDLFVLIQVIVGPVGAQGEESFDVLVCSSTWLARKVEQEGPVFGRNYLVVPAWDMKKIRRVLINAFEGEEAPTWSELAGRLGRIGKWEFEDYCDLRASGC